MLVSDHFLFFLEISYDLGQALLEDLDLVLVSLDLVRLHIGALLVLLFSTCIDRNVSFDLAIRLFLATNFFLMLFKFVPLANCL